ncbi:MAG: glycosyltransferase family 1 protein [Pseudomonadota bacterium]
MKIAIVTDAWKPQVNGVITTLVNTGECLIADGHEVHYVTPQDFLRTPCPTYPEIRLSLFPGRKVARMLDELQPDSIHIATEGPLGLAARKYCLKRKLLFTTSYHTRFPQYVRARFPIPLSWSYGYMRWFHSAAAHTMVGTETQREDLVANNFENVVLWPRGVDTEAFHPDDKDFLKDERPISMYVGRVAVEKTLEDFLSLDIPGTKYIVGDGPALKQLQRDFPEAVYTGYRFGEELTRYLAAADVFVFPSRTDTLGLVLLEAMACGVPVAAYPVMGPIDVVDRGVTGILDEDLAAAVKGALALDAKDCREAALERSWRSASRSFFANLVDAARPDGQVDARNEQKVT